MNRKDLLKQIYHEEQAALRALPSQQARVAACNAATTQALIDLGISAAGAESLLVYITQFRLDEVVQLRRVAFSTPERATAVKAIEARHREAMSRISEEDGQARRAIRETLEAKYRDQLV